MIRNVRKSDAHQIAEVHVAAWRSAYRGLISDDVLASLSVLEREKRWRSTISEGIFPTIVAILDHQIVGFSNFGASRDPDIGDIKIAEILAIYVYPDQWDKGLGRRLMQETLQQLCSSGFKVVTLWVLGTNSRARSFYEKAGFSEDGATKIDHCETREALNEVRYRLIL